MADPAHQLPDDGGQNGQGDQKDQKAPLGAIKPGLQPDDRDQRIDEAADKGGQHALGHPIVAQQRCCARCGARGGRGKRRQHDRDRKRGDRQQGRGHDLQDGRDGIGRNQAAAAFGQEGRYEGGGQGRDKARQTESRDGHPDLSRSWRRFHFHKGIISSSVNARIGAQRGGEGKGALRRPDRSGGGRGQLLQGHDGQVAAIAALSATPAHRQPPVSRRGRAVRKTAMVKSAW